MNASEMLRVTRTVDAGAEQVFAVLADPGRHTELDGSSLLRGLASGSTLTGVGDQFVMNMHNDILGDYQVCNTVVAYEKNRKIGWAPNLHPADGYTDKIGDMKTGGHTYTWELEPAGAGKTTVTQIYDWGKVPDPRFKGLFPMLSKEQLDDSIERAGRAKP